MFEETVLLDEPDFNGISCSIEHVSSVKYNLKKFFLQNIFSVGVPFEKYMQPRVWIQVGRVGPILRAF